jgi:hypothetical protein
MCEIAGPGESKHSAGDGGCPLSSVDNLGECALAVGWVGIPKPELGVVEDRRQRVIEFVDNSAGQNSKAANALKSNDLPAKRVDSRRIEGIGCAALRRLGRARLSLTGCL